MRQKNQVKLNFGTGATGEAPRAAAEETEARAARADIESRAAVGPSMEAIVERNNLRKALARVKANKGAAGIDGMTFEDLAPYLKEHWPAIRAQLLDGTYKPQPVRRVEIPKASGGKRPLGIPTVLDRFIQQAVMQVLQADWDRTFSEASFGFRPGRSAHQEADPRLSDRGGAGGWAGQPDGRRHAARRAALAAVVEPDAGRAGQGIGEAQPLLRALRR